MARIADPDKIENIKRAVKECIIEFGYGAVPTALICQKAGVSPGYLYRFYESKDELIHELILCELTALTEEFNGYLDTYGNIYKAAYKMIEALFLTANEDRLTAMFRVTIVLNLMIPQDKMEQRLQDIMMLADKIIAIGNQTGEIKPNNNPLDILVVAFTIPFRYVQFSLKINNEKKFGKEEIEKITNTCINAFK